MVDVQLAGSVVSARAAFFPAHVVCLKTLGSAAPGDGGAATYLRATASAAQSGCFRSACGTQWKLAGSAVNVRQFGAAGDGVADDSVAIQAAPDHAGAGEVHFPSGRYRATGLRLRRSSTLAGSQAELFWNGGDGGFDLLFASAPEVTIGSLSFRGDVYSDIHSEVWPKTLLRVEDGSDESIAKLTLIDVDFTGGETSCWIGMVADIFIGRIRIRTYHLLPRSQLSCG